MTEPDAFRHYCRNPRCRSKLPAPVSNPREAIQIAAPHSVASRTETACHAKAVVKIAGCQLLGATRLIRPLLVREHSEFPRQRASASLMGRGFAFLPRGKGRTGAGAPMSSR